MNAYSEDLRKKIVETLRRGSGKSEAARAFGVSFSSVKRYARRADKGRSLAPKRRPGSRPKIGEDARRLLEELTGVHAEAVDEPRPPLGGDRNEPDPVLAGVEACGLEV